MELVEIVRISETSNDTLASAVAWVLAQRKTPLVVRDAPGFVVNRILTAMIDAAVALFESGLPVVEIDRAFREFGFRGGPFEIMDVIGIDTVVNAGRGMFAQGVRQVSASPLLPMLMKKKRWGRKSGGGFYDYETLDGPAQISNEAERLLQPYQRSSEASTTADSIVHLILTNMLIAATEILSSNVVADPRDIDLAMIKGLGFPSHHGGLLFWAGRVNRRDLQASLDWNLSRLASITPSQMLVDWMHDQRPFYTTV
jgi:3-hydroxyacyl-CoA dehydrogenase/enoyl-CoA hydratase/3-hydroxybutyryl-CoA epimerase/3-hydroxyacyl-CoA dehydrogenase/enoyl-CoA hydratase/3-hydroxybutyryl-CoA epimerase/enoyl-CoA isomerase